MEFLTVDHINGGGKEHRKQLAWHGTYIYRDLELKNYPKDRFRLLCMNCNFATRYGSQCPHRRSING